jgi:hypothetical protein
MLEFVAVVDRFASLVSGGLHVWARITRLVTRALLVHAKVTLDAVVVASFCAVRTRHTGHCLAITTTCFKNH